MELSKLKQRLEILWQEVERLERETPGPGPGTSDYEELSNKPSINGHILIGNKTSSQLGIITESDIIDAFTPSTITIEEGGTFPSDTRNLLSEHKPIMINDTQYQFLSESGIDYVYAAVPPSGAYPTITYFRVMKNSFSVEFHETAMDTVPTASSDNFITSGGVYTALSAKANSADLGTAAYKNVDTSLNSSSTNPVENKAITNKVFDMDANLSAIRVMLGATLYGFRINKNDSNPSTRVEYLYDNANFAPAAMDFTEGEFDYGDWANAWFITGNKPCALKYDGTIDYYLDPDDYTKKADGTASDVSDSSYAGNFMASMPTVWIRRWEDGNYQYFAFSNKQVNSDFKAYAHDAGDGFINDFIYLPMFKGAVIDSKLRSIAGVIPGGLTTATQDKTNAEANGSGWQTWDWSKHCLITDLLTLISRTTNSQAAFGGGSANTQDTEDTQAHGMLTTGTSGSGQFYGTNDWLHHVKVFHIEDYWGNRFDTCLGLNRINGNYMCKPVRPYSVDGDSTYINLGTAPTSGTWIKSLSVNEYGWVPSETGATDSTYYCDEINIGVVSTNSLARICGMNGNRNGCGTYDLHISRVSSNTLWFFGASPCFNATHST